jgi:hypothetical protein
VDPAIKQAAKNDETQNRPMGFDGICMRNVADGAGV